MGLFDKIKNALFEEEYVEVEEKPKKPKKEVLKSKNTERPIAKKVVLPEKKEIKVIEELEDDDELIDEDFEIQPKKVSEPKTKVKPEVEPDFEEVKPDFKVMDEEDFKVEEEVKHRTEPKIVKVIEREEPVREEPRYYPNKREKQPYGMDETRVSVSEYGRSSYDSTPQYGAYERKEDRTHFKPSPIISPIYGILDKNYRKEDVVTTKRESRIITSGSNYAKETLSVDDVRKKAYGSLSDDIAKEIEEPKKVATVTTFEVEEKDDDNLLVDLSDDAEKPAVKEVTMGDALEYFEDLGLEYNVDYVDASKNKATGRRIKENYEDGEDTTVEEEAENEEKPVIEKEEVSIDSDDNLFDLIDSMYKESD